MPGPIVTLNGESLKTDLRERVRKTVEERRAASSRRGRRPCGAERHGRTAGREAYRVGHHERKLAATSGEVAIRMPKPRE